MMIVGVTGPTGAGKSIVCRLMKEWESISVIDCDKVAHQVVRRGERCLLDLAVEFSSAIIDADGELNRRKLASIVFHDREKLRRMEEIMYPHILAKLDRRLEQRKKKGYRAVFLDAPTLYQSGADALCQQVVAILAPAGDRLGRIMKRDRLTEEEAKARMASQPGDDFFLSRADHIIFNTGRMPALRLDVLELQNKLEL